MIKKLIPAGMLLLAATPASSQSQTHTCIVIQPLTAEQPLVSPTSTRAYRVSWLVGMVTADRQYLFAAAVWRPSGAVDTLDAARLAVRQFIESGLLPKGK